MNEVVIRTSGLKKVYKTKTGWIEANLDVDFVAKRAEIVAILGPNGAGKSTFVKQIIGYLSPSSGEVEVLGQSIQNGRRTMLARIGYMMQSRYGHWDHLTVRDALYYSGILKKCSHQETIEHMEHLAQRLELNEEMKKVISSLSGGKRQATALACAVIGFPELLILDEPTTGLDPEKRALFWEFLTELNRERETTILIITHNINEVERVAHRVVIMGNGKILKDGSPDELKHDVIERVRIELDFHSKKCLGEIMNFLSDYMHTWAPDRSKLFIYVSQATMVNCIEKLFTYRQISECVQNIQIYKSSLEDVYIKIMGEKMCND